MPIPRLVDETAEPQTLDEVREWHRGIVDALVELRGSALRSVRGGPPAAARFVGMTEEEVHRYFEAQRRELDRLTVLNLVASAEATIRVDFFRRVKERLRDRLSVAYRDWFRDLTARKQLRPDFDEGGILDIIKRIGIMDNNIVGRFRECMHARHWVGHGRFWAKPPAVDSLDPDDVYARAEAILLALPS